MKKVINLGMFGLGLLLISGCSSSDNQANISEGAATVASTESESSQANVEETSETIEDLESETEGQDGIIAIGDYSADWSESWNGLDFKIDRVAIAEMTDEEVESQGIENNYIVMVNYVITNNGDKDFYTYPDQGVLVVEGQQVDAELFGSDDLGGEILQGVTKEGAVIYSVKNIEDVTAVKNIRLKWSANYDTDDWEEESHKDFDVTFDLNKQ